MDTKFSDTMYRTHNKLKMNKKCFGMCETGSRFASILSPIFKKINQKKHIKKIVNIVIRICHAYFH